MSLTSLNFIIYTFQVPEVLEEVEVLEVDVHHHQTFHLLHRLLEEEHHHQEVEEVEEVEEEADPVEVDLEDHLLLLLLCNPVKLLCVRLLLLKQLLLLPKLHVCC